ncbi:MAG TPA: heavy metal translocating P-type ATPase [Anaerolineae bacterium]|nr:heavy metal translocating P-type ATPase [Anaerolineae bacterium]
MNKELSLTVTGADCACDVSEIEGEISTLEGVRSCVFNPITGRLRVEGNVLPGTVIESLQNLGYHIVEQGVSSLEQDEKHKPIGFLQFMWRSLDTRLAIFGAILILPGVILSEILGRHHLVIDLTSIAAYITAGFPIARSAWRSLRRNFDININVLMTIAAIGALAIGAYTEAGMVIVLFAIGEALEGYVVDKARASIQSLVEVAPQRATLIHVHEDQIHEIRVLVETLQIGDLILVKPGERIPMDGRVVTGNSSVNQAPITGEGRLVEKIEESEVLASTINGEGSLRIEVTRLAKDNTISRLIRMVEEAQEKKAPAQRFVDRFAKLYTPLVVLLAAAVAIVPPLFFNQPFLNPASGSFGWLYRGLALLVVACPCALVISTPVSIISAISTAARRGILVKGGTYLETLSRVEAMAFDKTGTITEGRPSVVAVRSVNCQIATSTPPTLDEFPRCEGCDDLLALASAIEAHSEHPVADAIVHEAKKRGVEKRYPAAEGVRAHVGHGVTGRVNGTQVTIGSHNYFDRQILHPEDDCLEAKEDAINGFTTVMVEKDGQFQGTIVLADVVRMTSPEAIAMLKRVGVKTLVMLTGDNRSAAEKVGAQVGVTEVLSELMPEEKVTAVRNLQREHGYVAMVGDGINDTPALATADVGIAVGGAWGGTAQAMETSDITLLSEDLRQLPFLRTLSRATMRTIHVNVGLSLLTKLAFLILVLLGLGTMWMAVLADMGTSLLVTLNGMRLLQNPQKSPSSISNGED